MRTRIFVVGLCLAVAGCSSGGDKPDAGTATASTVSSGSGSGSSSSASSSGSSASSTGTSSSSSGSTSSGSSSASSSSSGSTGATGLTFHAFCAQVSQPACPYLTACQLIDPDAGNCDVYGAAAFGCGTDPEDELNAGYYDFDAAQGQACLDAFTAASDCTSTTEAAIAASCASLLVPHVAVGGGCISDDNCIPPSPGTAPSSLFGCDTEDGFNQTGCSYICSYGHHLGELCGSGLNGSGCAEGTCVLAQFDDGGESFLCTTGTPTGGVCSTEDGFRTTCADPNDFCNLSSGVCEAMAGPGGSCDPAGCVNGLGCACSPGTVCTAGGTCQAPLDGGDCPLVDCNPDADPICPCAQLPSSFCQPPLDGGEIGACQPLQGVGASCDLNSCPGNTGCSCQAGLLCEGVGDGGAVCTAKVGVGGSCLPGRCFSEDNDECTCDLTQSVYCDSSNVCLPRVTLGGACSTSEISQCADGLSCSNGFCVDTNPATLGEPCAPNNDVWCVAPLTCSDFADGVCVVPSELGEPCFVGGVQPCQPSYLCAAVADGGGICGPQPGLGATCSELCRGLLTCDFMAFIDGGFGASCVAQSGIGGPCDPGEPETCVQGYCDQATSVCLPQSLLGQPCDPGQRDPCEENATCESASEGNSTCTAMCPEAG